MSKLTILKPSTLEARLTSLEKSASTKAKTTGEEAIETLRINGFFVNSVVKPTYRKGCFYRLFYVNGKRVAKKNVASKLLSTL